MDPSWIQRSVVIYFFRIFASNYEKTSKTDTQRCL